jgi:hypothetical protein
MIMIRKYSTWLLLLATLYTYSAAYSSDVFLEAESF